MKLEIKTVETYVLELTWEELAIIRAALGQITPSAINAGLRCRDIELDDVDVSGAIAGLSNSLDEPVRRKR